VILAWKTRKNMLNSPYHRPMRTCRKISILSPCLRRSAHADRSNCSANSYCEFISALTTKTKQAVLKGEAHAQQNTRPASSSRHTLSLDNRMEPLHSRKPKRTRNQKTTAQTNGKNHRDNSKPSSTTRSSTMTFPFNKGENAKF